jgi:hypothetical protein
VRRLPLIACLLVGTAGLSFAQASYSLRDTTGGRQVDIRILHEPLPSGLLVRSFMSNGEYHEVEYGPSAATVRYRVLSPSRNLDYTVRRDGNLLRFEGTFRGKPLSRTQKIDDHDWLETIELSLSAFARSSDRTSPAFWIVNPWEAKAFLMQATNEGADAVMVAGTPTASIRVRVRPAGFLAIFWSSLYWYRAADGLFVRYEAVRGLPGTPLTVVELMPP